MTFQIHIYEHFRESIEGEELLRKRYKYAVVIRPENGWSNAFTSVVLTSLVRTAQQVLLHKAWCDGKGEKKAAANILTNLKNREDAELEKIEEQYAKTTVEASFSQACLIGAALTFRVRDTLSLYRGEMEVWMMCDTFRANVSQHDKLMAPFLIALKP